MKQQNITPFGLRLQPDLRERLDRARLKDEPNEVPLNTEIVMRLEQSFAVHKSISEYTDGELLDELIRRWGRDAVSVSVKIGDKETKHEQPDAKDG